MVIGVAKAPTHPLRSIECAKHWMSRAEVRDWGLPETLNGDRYICELIREVQRRRLDRGTIDLGNGLDSLEPCGWQVKRNKGKE